MKKALCFVLVIAVMLSFFFAGNICKAKTEDVDDLEIQSPSYVLIEKGNAKIVPNTTSVTGYTQMELYENATGEQSLKTKTN